MTNPLLKLRPLGQSIWLDDIHRAMLENGEFEAFIEKDGISGVTSNPAILKKAILDHDDYDVDIAMLRKEVVAARTAYERLVIADLQAAADILRPTYETTEKLDGYVSLEVSPHYAYDTAKTLEAAKRLWQMLDRPNVMIKVPATREGIPAIRELIAEGINVNATLIFSLARYRDVIQAYQDGLSDRLKTGFSIKNIASVASYFMSRIDVLVDRKLDELQATADEKNTALIQAIRGQTAVASAKLAYQHYKRIVSGEHWQTLKAEGAKPQRLLWASTSTKDPSFEDVKYVDELIGTDTVNTLPLKTLLAYRDHGNPKAARIESDVEVAIATLSQLAQVGINLGACLQQLEDEGVQKFVKPFDELLSTLEEKLL
ncbi:MAG: transaldolase [Gammaproteobacteria bacterium]